MVEIVSAKLIQAIQQHPAFGTGTLSETAQCHPDELQRLIAREKGSLEFVEKIEGLLNITVRKLPEVPLVVEPIVEESNIEDGPVEPDVADDKQGENEKPDVDLPAESNQILSIPTEPLAMPLPSSDIEIEAEHTKNRTFKELEGENEEGKTSSPPVEIELTPIEVTNLPSLEIDCDLEQINKPTENVSKPEPNYQLLARTLSISKIRRRFGTEGFDYSKMLEAEQGMKKPRKSLIEMLEKCIKESNGNSTTNS